jgi:tetratricopeptide (TPR) repeat protein
MKKRKDKGGRQKMLAKLNPIVTIVLVVISLCIFAPIVTATTAEEWNEQGFRFLESGDCEKAIECFDKAIGLNPKYTDAYLNRGLAYWYLEQNERAIADFEKVIELNPCYDQACRAREFVLSILKQENGYAAKAATPTLTTTLTITPTVPPPEATPTPEPVTPTPGGILQAISAFEAVFAVAGFFTIAYVLLRRWG